MTHEEHWDFERNGYKFTLVGQVPPSLVFPYGRFASGNNLQKLNLGF